MGELIDDIPPAIPPRLGVPNPNNSGYSSLGTGYSTFSGYGLNNNLGRRVGYGSPYEPYSRYNN